MFNKTMSLTILVSLILGASASSALVLWVSMELNLLGFLGWLVSMSEDSAVKVKYFLIQSVSSAVFFLGLLFNLVLELSSLIVLLGISLKLGLAPFHSWVIQILEDVNTPGMFMILSVQKLLPGLVLLSMAEWLEVSLLLFLGLVTSIIGALYQSSWKKILGYSSVFTGGWLLLGQSHLLSALLFFAAYSISILLVLLSVENLFTSSVQVSGLGLSKTNMFQLSLGLFSVAGLPPFLGFFGKVALITSAFMSFSISLIYMIISSSAFMVFVYMRLLYSFTPLTLAEPLVLQESPKLVSILLFVLLGGGLVFMYMCGCYMSKFEFEDNN